VASKVQAFELKLAKKEKHLLLFFAFLSRYVCFFKSLSSKEKEFYYAL
jgi:hypothetical protein